MIPMHKENFFQNIPKSLPNELFEVIQQTEQLKIERIVSDGHASPAQGWYDQSEHEWVMVLQGEGVIEFETGEVMTLSVGDYLNIPAHVKHKVLSTSSTEQTVWLAIFY